MGVALAAVADDRDLPVEEAEVAVAMDRGHDAPFGVSGRVGGWGGAIGRAARARSGRCGTSSRMPCGRTSSSNESICSGSPTISKTIESGADVGDAGAGTPRRAPSARPGARAAPRPRSARARARPPRPRSSSRTRSTLTSLCICFSICASGCWSQLTRSVIDETSCRSVGPTARLSMLYPRRANSWQTRTSAPGLFSTRTDSVWITPTPPRSRRASSYSTMSSAAAPAGIIGKHCSLGVDAASTTAVRPHASASRSASSRSPSSETVKPAAP